MQSCPDCRGTGKWWDRVCKECGGVGRITVTVEKSGAAVEISDWQDQPIKIRGDGPYRLACQACGGELPDEPVYRYGLPFCSLTCASTVPPEVPDQKKAPPRAERA